MKIHVINSSGVSPIPHISATTAINNLLSLFLKKIHNMTNTRPVNIRKLLISTLNEVIILTIPNTTAIANKIFIFPLYMQAPCNV